MQNEAGFPTPCAHAIDPKSNIQLDCELLGKNMCFGVSLSSLTSPVRQELKEAQTYHASVGTHAWSIVHGYRAFGPEGAPPMDLEMTRNLK